MSKVELTDDHASNSPCVATHAWIPKTIASSSPGDLETHCETLPDHWIELDAVTGDDNERWPTEVLKQTFLHKLIEAKWYPTSKADAQNLAPILAEAIGELVDKKLADLSGAPSPVGTAFSRLEPDHRKSLSFHLKHFFGEQTALGESARVSSKSCAELTSRSLLLRASVSLPGASRATQADLAFNSKID